MRWLERCIITIPMCMQWLFKYYERSTTKCPISPSKISWLNDPVDLILQCSCFKRYVKVLSDVVVKAKVSLFFHEHEKCIEGVIIMQDGSADSKETFKRPFFLVLAGWSVTIQQLYFNYIKMLSKKIKVRLDLLSSSCGQTVRDLDSSKWRCGWSSRICM